MDQIKVKTGVTTNFNKLDINNFTYYLKYLVLKLEIRILKTIEAKKYSDHLFQNREFHTLSYELLGYHSKTVINKT